MEFNIYCVLPDIHSFSLSEFPLEIFYACAERVIRFTIQAIQRKILIYTEDILYATDLYLI
jgi:hypothetical protein